MIDYIKVFGTDACPTCNEKLVAEVKEKKSLVPNIGKNKSGTAHRDPFITHTTTSTVVYCRDPELKTELYEHFSAILYSENDYDIVRRVLHNKQKFSTRISIKDGEQIYSNFSIDSHGMMEKKKNYVFLSNEELITKINSLLMLK